MWDELCLSCHTYVWFKHHMQLGKDDFVSFPPVCDVNKLKNFSYAKYFIAVKVCITWMCQISLEVFSSVLIPFSTSRQLEVTHCSPICRVIGLVHALMRNIAKGHWKWWEKSKDLTFTPHQSHIRTLVALTRFANKYVRF